MEFVTYFGDFRPISFVSFCYKLVFKVLATKLYNVMDKIMYSNQSTIFKGLLVYGVVAVNEIVDLTKKSKKDCLIFKMDFEKPYNSINQKKL